MSDNNSMDFFKGLFIGGAVGAAIALLYAPKSGKETREDLSQKADEVYDKLKAEYDRSVDNAQKSIQAAQKRLDELGKLATKKADEISGSVSDLVEKGKENIDDQKGRLKHAMDAAKEAYSEEKSSKKKS